MKERYDHDIRFNASNRKIVDEADAIIERYIALNQRMTLRQIYYVFIGEDLLPSSWIDEVYNKKHGLAPDTKNTIKNYKRLGGLISDGRLAGILDWDAIEDRGRRPDSPSEWNDVGDLLETAFRSYRLPRWKGQTCYAELWVEKDALAGVLAPLAREAHVTLMVNKGYSSQSAMYASAQRFCEHECDKHLFYLGDFDPSGEDMVRDIEDRLKTFGVEGLSVTKVALTMPQIRRHRLPPNPTKVSDGRAGVRKDGSIVPGGYVDVHGWESWEVDALRPDVLSRLIREAFDTVINRDAMDAVIAQEDADKKELRTFLTKRASKGKKK